MSDIQQSQQTETPTAETLTGAEIVVRCLVDQGVDVLFGYPGGAVLPIYDALFHEPRLRHVLVRHEQGAGHAAEGYARTTISAPVRVCAALSAAAGSVSWIGSAVMAVFRWAWTGREGWGLSQRKRPLGGGLGMRDRAAA